MQWIPLYLNKTSLRYVFDIVLSLHPSQTQQETIKPHTFPKVLNHKNTPNWQDFNFHPFPVIKPFNGPGRSTQWRHPKDLSPAPLRHLAQHPIAILTAREKVLQWRRPTSNATNSASWMGGIPIKCGPDSGFYEKKIIYGLGDSMAVVCF